MKSGAPMALVLALLFGLYPMGSPGVFARSIEELAGPENTGALLAGEKPVLVQFREARPRLIPRNETLMKLVEDLHRDLNPGVMVETLNIYRKPPNAESGTWSEEERAKLYNGALALSTLTGIQYYSATRDSMRTFYEFSSVIDGPSSKKPVADPVYARPPEKITIYARQKDLSFGDNIYQYDYHSIPGGLIFIQQNLTSLSYDIIPAVGKNNLHSAFAVLDAGNYLLVYAASMAKAASIPGMRERIGNSFANRAEAIFLWFSSQADKTFTGR